MKAEPELSPSPPTASGATNWEDSGAECGSYSCNLTYHDEKVSIPSRDRRWRKELPVLV